MSHSGPVVAMSPIRGTYILIYMDASGTKKDVSIPTAIFLITVTKAESVAGHTLNIEMTEFHCIVRLKCLYGT